MLPPDEPRITLAQAKVRYPGTKGMRHIHTATITRWIIKGAKAKDGTIVKLEAEKTPLRWLTSEGALARFAAALAGTAVKPTRSPAERNRAAATAGKQLATAGA